MFFSHSKRHKPKYFIYLRNGFFCVFFTEHIVHTGFLPFFLRGPSHFFFPFFFFCVLIFFPSFPICFVFFSLYLSSFLPLLLTFLLLEIIARACEMRKKNSSSNYLTNPSLARQRRSKSHHFIMKACLNTC